ncbi:MAG: dihydroorotase [Porticoccaceae bacterium]|nr:dihydroorotase [Porticoccaceae bacterium]
MEKLVITRPDDWHAHLRDNEALTTTVPAAARYFGRTIVMPNLVPPVLTTPQAEEYQQRILAQRPAGSRWQPLMVLYLTDRTTPQDIRSAKASGFVKAAKYYPAGATTNSDSGVTSLNNIYPVLATMEEVGLPLLLHGEVTDGDIDIFDREAVFIERHLSAIVSRFPDLKIVLEHITTQEGAQFVAAASANVAATITPQHLLFNRNAMLAGGIRPHFYCLPILKRNIHQEALIHAATSGNPKFFLGTDSAPHTTANKEAACGCAGCYSHHAPLELYAELFDRENALDKLEGFASCHGSDFYGLPRNTDTITLIKKPWQVPNSVMLGNDAMTPLWAGNALNWQILDGINSDGQ